MRRRASRARVPLESMKRFPVCVLSLASACSILALASCDSKQPATPVPTISADSPAAQHKAIEIRPGVWRYTTRGEITRLPGKTGLAQDMAIHHEALADFYNRDGSNPGMPTMEMDFPSIAPGVSLEGLAVGDIVVFDFDVDWKSRDFWTVTRIAKLPPGTPLKFGSGPEQPPSTDPSQPPK